MEKVSIHFRILFHQGTVFVGALRGVKIASLALVVNPRATRFSSSLLNEEPNVWEQTSASSPTDISLSFNALSIWHAS